MRADSSMARLTTTERLAGTRVTSCPVCPRLVSARSAGQVNTKTWSTVGSWPENKKVMSQIGDNREGIS